jgi:4-amino-4-deoxy-L-arabinose transferase-like glycosyltransferase
MNFDQWIENFVISKANYLKIVIFILLSCVIVAIITLASAPPVDRDALTHHLFVPKLWLQHGGIYEIPEIPFSYYPMNLELLYTIPLYFGNDIIPKYIHFLFALLTALLLYRHLKKRLGVEYGLLGAAFFLSVPIIVKLSITAYVDLGLIFFTTASLLLLLHWAEQNFEWGPLALAGLCCGLAAGTKYNGLVSVIVLTLFVPIIYQQNALKERQHNGKALLFGCVFGMAALTSFSPWLIRNYAWTGNPIYPLHNSLFQKFHDPVSAQQPAAPIDIGEAKQQVNNQGNNAFISRKILYNETWQQALLLPFRFFYEGQDDNPQFFDGKLSPFLLLLPILGFYFKPTDTMRKQEQRLLFYFASLYFFLTFFQQVLRIRYIVPIVPALVILSMYGLHGFVTILPTRLSSKIFKKIAVPSIAICIIIFMLWYNLQYIAHQFNLVQPLPYLRNQVSREAYITAFRPEYPVIQYANASLTPHAKVLCIFLGNRGYYMNFHPIFEQPYSDGIFSRIISSQDKQVNIMTSLKQNNITHIIMREDLTVNWLQRLPQKDKFIISPLFSSNLKLLFHKNGYNFFKIENTNNFKND